MLASKTRLVDASWCDRDRSMIAQQAQSCCGPGQALWNLSVSAELCELSGALSRYRSLAVVQSVAILPKTVCLYLCSFALLCASCHRFCGQRALPQGRYRRHCDCRGQQIYCNYRS